MLWAWAAASAAANLGQRAEQMSGKRTVFQLAPQRDAVDELGDNEDLPVRFLKLMHRRNRPMLELRGHLRFRASRSRREGSSVFGGQGLQGHRAIEHLIAREIHDAHSASCDLAHDAILANRLSRKGEARCPAADRRRRPAGRSR